MLVHRVAWSILGDRAFVLVCGLMRLLGKEAILSYCGRAGLALSVPRKAGSGERVFSAKITRIYLVSQASCSAFCSVILVSSSQGPWEVALYSHFIDGEREAW